MYPNWYFSVNFSTAFPPMMTFCHGRSWDRKTDPYIDQSLH